MKSSVRFLLVLVAMAALMFATQVRAEAPFHIGIMTGTVSQSEDEMRGAEKAIELFGSVDKGGMIQHLTYPDQFMQEQETTITQISSFADDPLMKAIIVNEAVPGTVEGFRRVREKRPDILLIAAEAHEDPLVAESAADLVENLDFYARGYTIIWVAKQLGCDTFVHISFPRHMSYETLGTRRLIMEEVCKELGLKFVFETAPDPTSDVGVAGAQQYILEKVPAWIEKYGKKAAFFCTNNAHTEPLLKQLVQYGGYFIEPDTASPLMGFPGALGVDLADVKGDFPKIVKRIEEAIVAKGAGGRLGTWTYSSSFTNGVAMVDLAKSVIEGKAELTKMEDILASYAKYTPGAEWKAGFYVDRSTGAKAKNHVLLYQDTYIFGKGYMGATKIEIPEKYLNFKKK